jgi:hypothetical protein
MVLNGQVTESEAQREFEKAGAFQRSFPRQNDPSSFNAITTDLELAEKPISSKVNRHRWPRRRRGRSGSVNLSGGRFCAGEMACLRVA